MYIPKIVFYIYLMYLIVNPIGGLSFLQFCISPIFVPTYIYKFLFPESNFYGYKKKNMLHLYSSE